MCAGGAASGARHQGAVLLALPGEQGHRVDPQWLAEVQGAHEGQGVHWETVEGSFYYISIVICAFFLTPHQQLKTFSGMTSNSCSVHPLARCLCDS